MEISKTLEEALESKNIGRIRSVFYTIAHEDPSFSTGKFRQTLDFVKGKEISGLFDIFDGGEFKDESEWTSEYWADVASELMDNFCEERINHLQKVGQKIFPVQVKKNNTPIQQMQNKTGQSIQQENHQSSQKIGILIGIGVIVVIVILLVVLF